MNRKRHGISFALGVVFFSAIASISPTAAGADGHGDRPVPLTLQNVAVRPGKPYVVSIRTCQPRGISQGQILIRRPPRPLMEPVRTHLFCYTPDGVMQTSTEPAGLLSSFASPLQGINENHGPFLAILMRAEPDLIPGDVLPLEIDAIQTYLLEEEDEPSPFITLDSTLTVLEPDAPFLLEITDLYKRTQIAAPVEDEVIVTISTREFLRLSELAFVLRFDPTVVDSVETDILWDYRNDVFATTEEEQPGVYRVRLESPRNSINLLPGPLVEVKFETRLTAIVGQTTPITFDPDSTYALDRQGAPLLLDLRDAELTVIEGESP